MHLLVRIVIIASVAILPSLVFSAQIADKSPYQTLAEDIVNGFTAQNPNPFDQSLNADAILNTAFAGIQPTEKWARGFREGMEIAITSKLGKNLLQLVSEGSYAKLLRMKYQDDGAHALIRLDYGDNGNNYMDLNLAKDDEGNVKVIDWFDYSAGQLYTESLRQLIATAAPNKNVFARLYDLALDKKSSSDMFKKLTEMNKEGKHKSVVDTFLMLNEDDRKKRILNIIALKSANISADMDRYQRVLENIDQYFGDDPTMGFVLIDYYFLTGRYNRAIECIDQLQRSIDVEDAGLISFKANAYYSKGDFKNAEAQAWRAINVEPEYESSYWSLINSQVSLRKYEEALNTAEILQNRFYYDMSPESLSNAGGDFTALVNSKVYIDWWATR